VYNNETRTELFQVLCPLRSALYIVVGRYPLVVAIYCLFRLRG